MYIKHCFFLLFLTIVSFSIPPTFAQQITVQSIRLDNPLLSRSVYRIYQDQEGFIWLGTKNGLYRYDAYRITSFRADLNNPKLLTDNEITCFTETPEYLLIGTQKGMNLLNKDNYQIQPFNEHELAQQTIRYVIRTQDGNIWIGSKDFIYRYDVNLTLKKKYKLPPSDGINQFYEDQAGRLWLTCWKIGLFLYDSSKDTFIPYPAIGKYNNPFRIFQDNKKQYWICTWEDGLYLFNPDTTDKEMYLPLSADSRTNNENIFFSITQDDILNYIWVMSMSGLHAFKYTQEGILESVDVSRLFTAYNNIFSEIIKDQAGNLWIGTYGEGILGIHFNKPATENIAFPAIKEQTGLTPHIAAIFEDKDHELWIQQDRKGLAFFTPSNNQICFYTDDPVLKGKEGLDYVSCISDFRSQPDEIWVGAERIPRIYCMKKDKNRKMISKEINLDKIKEDAGYPRMFYEDKKNNIWVATTTDLFVKPYYADSLQLYSSGFKSITGITEDTRGDIWISCQNTGLCRFISPNLRMIDKLQTEYYNKDNNTFISNNIEAIHADINGNIWISTREGHIIRYDIVEKKQKDISQDLRTLGEPILNITSDDFGHIWFVTNTRIIEYNPSNSARWYYTEWDGVLVNSFVNNSYFKSKTGKLYFGGNKGISVLNPSARLSEKVQNTKTIITDIKINEQSVFRNNNNQKFNIKDQTLTLDSEDKNIKIDFSTLDHTFPSKIHYAYKMEGIDEDWIYPEIGRQFAIYNLLSKGDHLFYVKATDKHGLWSDQITQFKIHKQPAFYESNLAYFIYICLSILLIYITYITVKNRITLRNKLKITQIEKEKTEELTQIKLKYFTNVTHDFLTPLTIISCQIDDMETAQQNKQINPTDFNTIRSNINRLRRLLQQILDFRKIESGNMQLKLSYGDIALFIKDTCYTNFIPLMKKKDIHFSFQAVPNQIYAYFDADKIDKIIFNLLSNAFKYTREKGEVKILLEKYIKHSHPHIQIKVEDTGIGIAPDNLKHIFTRFYHHTSDSISETNGIGLSLTKDLVELHSGTIQVESQLNKGTQFIVSIPIDEQSYNKIDLNETKQIIKHIDPDMTDTEEVTLIPKDKEAFTVLLVEDNEELLALMKKILSKTYHTFTANNGFEALEVIKKQPVDIIISDVMMPEMDGLTLCRKFKTDLETSHIPIILLTAKNSTEDRIECYNAGADGYISKPFELKVLEARISNFISGKKNKQQAFKSDVEINISTLEYPGIDEDFLKKAVQVIEEHLSEFDFDVNEFAENLHMSKSSLYRKIKTMTGLSPIEFIRNIKLKHACQMLKTSSLSIAEIAYASGFSDPKYFTTRFRAEFGMTPTEYQKS